MMPASTATLEIVNPDPKSDRSAAPVAEVMIQWSPQLVDRLRRILKTHRHGPEQLEHTSTPEMFMLALRREQRHENETLRQILFALADNPAKALDLDIIEMEDRLMRLTHETSEDNQS